MKIEFENKKTWYRLTLFLLGVVGLVIQFVTDGFNVAMYYTILSNLLVTFFLLYIIGRNSEWDNKLFRIKGGVTMAIMITFAVYHFLLSPVIEAKDFYTIENFICHYILPIGFFWIRCFWIKVDMKNMTRFCGHCFRWVIRYLHFSTDWCLKFRFRLPTVLSHIFLSM